MSKDALAALVAACFTIAACWGAGMILIERVGAKLARAEQVPLAFLLGASLVHLFVFAALAFHVGYKPVWVIGFLGLIIAGVWRSRVSGRAPLADARGSESQTNRNPDRKGGEQVRFHADSDRLSGEAKSPPGVPPAIRVLLAAISVPFTALYLVNAWAPETSPDGASYHLEIISRYLRSHRFERMPTNMYASLGQGVELVYAPAFALGKHSAAALVHLAFLMALALAIFAYGRRIGKPVVGAVAALLVYLSPVVARDGTTAYIDVAVAGIVFGVYYWLEIWDDQRNWRLLIPIGLLAGYAYAAKYTAFVILPYALLFILWRARKLRPALVTAAFAAVMIGPWMIKDWVFVRDPVAPFASGIFPDRSVHALAIEDWEKYLRRYDVANLWTLPVEDTVRGGKTQGIIGPVFLLVPLALFALRERAGRRLLLAGAVVLATYFGNVGTRFLIPCLPFFSLALAIALSKPAPLLPAILIFHAISSWPAMLPRYSAQYLWRIERFPWRGALGIESRERYLNENLGKYNLIRMVDAKVPPHERIFSPTGLASSYMTHELIESFQGALNNTLSDILFVAQYDAWQPTRALVFRFPERSMNRVRLIQTAQGSGMQQWNVHELRFFDHGREIARAPAWRLRAHPNPWEVQLAFDNSPVTRWRSWQTGAPGMFIEVDFGRAENVDEVRMETSHDYEWPFRFRVEANGAPVTDQFEEMPIHYRVPMRRAATYELAARGIHYLLIQDEDWGAADYNDDPELWGLAVVARSPGGTLFRVLP